MNPQSTVTEQLTKALPTEPQPPCIIQAFSRNKRGRFVLTMQGWIDLSGINSPLLQGSAPAGDDAFDQLKGAFEAFDYKPFELTQMPEEKMALLVQGMLRAVRHAFSTALPMKAQSKYPPQPYTPPNPEGADGGFGLWIPTLACLISQCRMTRADALATPVAQAFSIIAAVRHNEGWRLGGEPYADRVTNP